MNVPAGRRRASDRHPNHAVATAAGMSTAIQIHRRRMTLRGNTREKAEHDRADGDRAQACRPQQRTDETPAGDAMSQRGRLATAKAGRRWWQPARHRREQERAEPGDADRRAGCRSRRRKESARREGRHEPAENGEGRKATAMRRYRDDEFAPGAIEQPRSFFTDTHTGAERAIFPYVAKAATVDRHEVVARPNARSVCSESAVTLATIRPFVGAISTRTPTPAGGNTSTRSPGRSTRGKKRRTDGPTMARECVCMPSTTSRPAATAEDRLPRHSRPPQPQGVPESRARSPARRGVTSLPDAALHRRRTRPSRTTRADSPRARAPRRPRRTPVANAQGSFERALGHIVG